MNAIIYAINEISHTIPIELLQAGLTIEETPETVNINSLDDKILRKILKKRVLLDANIVGGIQSIIPLNNIAPSFFEHFFTVYQIPSELTHNKEILSALSLAFMPANGFFGQVGGHYGSSGLFNNSSFSGFNTFNPVMNVADRIGNAASSTGVLVNSHIEIVAYNTLLIYAHFRTLANFGVRVVLENDSNLNNIQTRSHKTFSKICVLATKAYIYNKLIIPINSGYLSGGQELGMFKTILESYSDAEEQYLESLKNEWAPTAYINDNTRYNRYIASMISPDL